MWSIGSQWGSQWDVGSPLSLFQALLHNNSWCSPFFYETGKLKDSMKLCNGEANGDVNKESNEEANEIESHVESIV